MEGAGRCQKFDMTVSKESGYMEDIKTIITKDDVEYDDDKQKHQEQTL